jgi:hypothetical protein
VRLGEVVHSPVAWPPTACTPRVRELVISFGASGYGALFKIEHASTVTIVAFRHQREEDCR